MCRRHGLGRRICGSHQLQRDKIAPIHQHCSRGRSRVDADKLKPTFRFSEAERIALRRPSGVCTGHEGPFRGGKIRDAGEDQLRGRLRRCWRRERRGGRRVLQPKYISRRDIAIRISFCLALAKQHSIKMIAATRLFRMLAIYCPAMNPP